MPVNHVRYEISRLLFVIFVTSLPGTHRDNKMQWRC